MKFFIIRYTKIAFLFLRLHILFNWISPLFSNLYYLTKFSLWANKNRKIPYNDFPSKWDYRKRFDLYKWILEKENLLTVPVNYMEFGVRKALHFVGSLNKIPIPKVAFMDLIHLPVCLKTSAHTRKAHSITRILLQTLMIREQNFSRVSFNKRFRDF